MFHFLFFEAFMTRHRIVVAAVAFLALAAVSATGSAQALPSATELMAKHDALTGGRAAMAKYSSIKEVGTMNIPAAGIDATMEVYKDKSGKFLQKMVLGAMGEASTGFDGTTAWQMQMGNASIVSGDQAKAMKVQADFFSGYHDSAKYKSAETVELADFDGRKCYKVKVILLDGTETFEYFDAATGLAAGTTRDVESPAGKITAMQILSDYKDFGGVKLPTKTTVKGGPVEVTMNIASVEFDTVTAAAFVAPDAVKALVKAPQ